MALLKLCGHLGFDLRLLCIWLKTGLFPLWRWICLLCIDPLTFSSFDPISRKKEPQEKCNSIRAATLSYVFESFRKCIPPPLSPTRVHIALVWIWRWSWYRCRRYTFCLHDISWTGESVLSNFGGVYNWDMLSRFRCTWECFFFKVRTGLSVCQIEPI